MLLMDTLNNFLSDRTTQNYQLVVACLFMEDNGCETMFAPTNGENEENKENKENVSFPTFDYQGQPYLPLYTSLEEIKKSPAQSYRIVDRMKMLSNIVSTKGVHGVLLNSGDRGGCLIEKDYILQMYNWL